MTLKYSFPKLTESLLDKVNVILNRNFGYSPIPADYRKFLLAHNGGYVSPGYIDDELGKEHTQEIVFDTPLRWAKLNDRPVAPCIIMFFGIWLADEMNENEVENWDLYDLITSNNHSRNDFRILPDNMMSIAKCSHPSADDMLCISLDKADYGSVYFYYGMYDYPSNFMGSYYDVETKRVYERYQIKSEADINSNTNEGRVIMRELARVPFVKVASSFAEFLNSCREMTART